MFSGIYDAINQRASTVLPEISPNSSPSRPTPRSSLDPSSPNLDGSVNGSDGSGNKSPGYSTYQRRSKPSLEDRLRASLAAKEQKRALEAKNEDDLPLPPVTEEPKRLDSELGATNGAQEIKAAGSPTTTRKESLPSLPLDAASVALPMSPPMPAAEDTSLQSLLGPELSQPSDQPLSNDSETPDPRVDKPTSSPSEDIQPSNSGTMVAPTTTSKQTEEDQNPRTVAPHGVSDVGTVLPPIPSVPEEEEDPSQTITLPPPPLPSKYDDPLTPALMELEMEREAAAAKAKSRLARSPLTPAMNPSLSSPTKLSASPSPSKQGFGHGRSRSMVPEGEPFIRYGGSASSFNSLDQLLRSPGVLSGLGLEEVRDVDGLKAWIEGLRKKEGTSQEQILRLSAKLSQQDGRIEEIRDMHRLESQSQSELVESLRQKLSETSMQVSALENSLATERSLLAAERSTRESMIAAERAKHSTGQADLESLKAKLKQAEDENTKLQGVAREEEEKRTKAISLLKTVRTKLVKAEKDRDDAQKELGLVRDNVGQGERMKEEELRNARIDLERARMETDRVKDEAMREFERRRVQLEGDMAALRDAMERDVLARRGEWEIEAIAAKSTHQKEITALNSRIATLSTSLSQISEEKARLFSDLQSRTSDLESYKSQVDELQSQLTEVHHQLRERDEQIDMLQVELSDARRGSSMGTSNSRGGRNASASDGAEVARLIAAAEARSEARVTELRSRIRTIEAERVEQEETWTRSLASRTDEVERLRALLSAQENEGRRAGDDQKAKDRIIDELEEHLKVAEADKVEHGRRLKALLAEVEVVKEKLETKDETVADLNAKVESLTGTLEDLRGKEAQLKATNRTLREELRKVQSSAALLERQRNPSAGYWGAAGSSRAAHTHGFSDSTPDLSRNATAMSQGRPGTPKSPKSAVTNGTGRAPSTSSARSSIDAGASSVQGEEEVNLEYIRNVILQFLENEKMRPNLVRVLSVILKFTPQETRRLVAKV